MLPPNMQRPMGQHMTGKQNPQAQQNANVNVPNNLLPMDQWGNRFPTTSNQGNQIIRPNNPMQQMVAPNQLQQQVSVTCRLNY